jgi:hypothetical protein
MDHFGSRHAGDIDQRDPVDVGDIHPALSSLEQAGLAPMYRMPTVFGPSPGPRNVPAAYQAQRYVHERTVATVEALTDADHVQRLLPDCCRQLGEPTISVSVSWLKNIGWLAGRGYNIVTVQFPRVAFAGANGEVVGDFNAVVWENLCDPIITGREEIAFPQIWAEIPECAAHADGLRGSAAWLGFPFFELDLTGLTASPAPTGARPVLVYKYIPRTGEWGSADAEYMTVSTADPLQPISVVSGHSTGRGRFAFNPARWEDMPTQYLIVNALSELPLLEFRNASLRTSSQGLVDSQGGGNFSGQRILR